MEVGRKFKKNGNEMGRGRDGSGGKEGVRQNTPPCQISPLSVHRVILAGREKTPKLPP